MRGLMTLRVGFVALGLLGACVVDGGCGSQSGTGESTVVPTTDDQLKQMELENQANEAAAKAAKTKSK